jgi:hypothetical protein
MLLFLKSEHKNGAISAHSKVQNQVIYGDGGVMLIFKFILQIIHSK